MLHGWKRFVVFATTSDFCGFVLQFFCRLLSSLKKERNRLERKSHAVNCNRHKQQVFEFYVFVWGDLRFRIYSLRLFESLKKCCLNVQSYPHPAFCLTPVSHVLSFFNLLISKPPLYSAFLFSTVYSYIVSRESCCRHVKSAIMKTLFVYFSSSSVSSYSPHRFVFRNFRWLNQSNPLRATGNTSNGIHRVIHKSLRISDLCGTVAGMVTPKWIMSKEGESFQVSVLPYRCSICPPLVTRQMSIL